MTRAASEKKAGGARFVASLTVVSADPERLVETYREILGLDFHRDEYGHPEPFHFAALGGIQLAVHPAANFPGALPADVAAGGDVRGGRPVRFALEVEDLEEVIERAGRRGLATRRPPQRRGPGILSAVLTDPDGNELTLVQRPWDWFAAVESSVRAWRRERAPRGPLARLRRAVSEQVASRRVRLERWYELEVAARRAYHRDRTDLRHRDLDGFSHLVATREGLFAVDRERCVLVTAGQFFGLTLRDGAIYLFEANGPLVAAEPRGRILRLDLEGARVRGIEVVAKGLDNGCHQIDFVGSRLIVTDTYNQALVVLEEGGDGRLATAAVHHPLGPAAMDAWDDGYAHVNSITAYRDEVYLLKHNGGFKTGRCSEVVRCNRELEVLSVHKLPAAMGHNLVFLEDGRLLCCDSRGGVVVDEREVVIDVGPGFTRGLSVGAEEVVVGESAVADRRTRQLFSSGKVHFFDRDLRRRACLEIPSAPTEIRRLDGRDLSLANAERRDPPPWPALA